MIKNFLKIITNITFVVLIFLVTKACNDQGIDLNKTIFALSYIALAEGTLLCAIDTM